MYDGKIIKKQVKSDLSKTGYDDFEPLTQPNPVTTKTKTTRKFIFFRKNNKEDKNNKKLPGSYRSISNKEILKNAGEVTLGGIFCDRGGKEANEIYITFGDKKIRCNKRSEPELAKIWSNLNEKKFANNHYGFFANFPCQKPIGLIPYKIQAQLENNSEKIVLEHGAINVNEQFLNKTKQSESFDYSKLSSEEKNYLNWLEAFDSKRQKKLAKVLNEQKNFPIQPLFSIVMVINDCNTVCLQSAVKSVKNQIYHNWQLCIVANENIDKKTKIFLTTLENDNEQIRIKFCKTGTKFTNMANYALKLTDAKSEFIGLLGQNDLLNEFALYEVAKAINNFPDIDYLYTDEDKFNEKGYRQQPHFKPDWSPDYFLARNYTQNFSVFRKSLLSKVGYFRNDFTGAETYDLALRIAEKARKIFHIDKILYSSYNNDNGLTIKEKEIKETELAEEDVILSAMHRRGLKAKRQSLGKTGLHRIKYEIIGNPLVSIVIPTISSCMDSQKTKPFIHKTLNSIRLTNTYPNIEIIIIDNGDLDKNKLKTLDLPKAKIKFATFPDHPVNFNIPNKLNKAVESCEGEHILLLNDDIEFIHEGWLEAMLELSQLKHIGAVGIKLLYPNGLLQHGGVVFHEGLPDHVHYRCDGISNGYQFNLKCVRNYSAITGACIMTKAKIYAEANGWDPKFPINFNDVDFCLRLRKLGYFNAFTPHATAIHHESSSREPRVNEAEFLLLRERWGNFNRDPFYHIGFGKGGNFELEL